MSILDQDIYILHTKEHNIHMLWSNLETTYKFQMKTNTPLHCCCCHLSQVVINTWRWSLWMYTVYWKILYLASLNNILMKNVFNPRMIIRRIDNCFCLSLCKQIYTLHTTGLTRVNKRHVTRWPLTHYTAKVRVDTQCGRTQPRVVESGLIYLRL